MTRSMGSHQSTGFANDEWLTPPEVIQAVGPFDLDPCAAHPRPWPTATRHLTKHDGGLTQAWEGRVWLNPPYGDAGQWLARLAAHGDGIALIFARTETKAFFEQVWNKATALLFLEGRLHFHHLDGRRAKANAGAPSVLVAYGGGVTPRCCRSAACPGSTCRSSSSLPPLHPAGRIPVRVQDNPEARNDGRRT